MDIAYIDTWISTCIFSINGWFGVDKTGTFQPGESVMWLVLKINLSTTVSMKRSRRELSIKIVIQKSTSKSNNVTHSPCFIRSYLKQGLIFTRKSCLWLTCRPVNHGVMLCIGRVDVRSARQQVAHQSAVARDDGEREGRIAVLVAGVQQRRRRRQQQRRRRRAGLLAAVVQRRFARAISCQSAPNLPEYILRIKDVWSLQTSQIELKLGNQFKKEKSEGYQRHLLCGNEPSRFESDRKSRFFQFNRAARVADLNHLRVKTLWLRGFCVILLLNDWQGMDFFSFVCLFQRIQQQRKLFYSYFRAAFSTKCWKLVFLG